MRLREPLNGIKLASGHWVFHAIFLIGSFLHLWVLEPSFKNDGDCDLEDPAVKWDKSHKLMESADWECGKTKVNENGEGENNEDYGTCPCKRYAY